MKYCAHCGAQMDDSAAFCPSCGAGCGVKVQPAQTQVATEPTAPKTGFASDKSRLVALLLVLFVGSLGVHRFYVGKIGTGVLYLLTGGLFGIGILVDLILIVCGVFKDADGKPLSNWGI